MYDTSIANLNPPTQGGQNQANVSAWKYRVYPPGILPEKY